MMQIRNPSSPFPWLAIALAALLLWSATPITAYAHFLLNLNVRILHVEHRDDGFLVFLRTPMPYLVADKVGEDTGQNLPEPAPFTSNARQNSQIVHFVSTEQVRSDPLGLGKIAEDGFVFDNLGTRLRGTVEAVRLHRIGQEPGFATLAEAQAALSSKGANLEASPALFVGDTVVDVMIRYTTGQAITSYAVSSSLDPQLPDQENTANLILDYGPGEPKIFRSRGLLAEPIEITRSSFAGFATFIWEGVRHILEGLDHVLFVICLVLGAIQLRSLLWRVTGFTLGHSVTLAIGFFGFVPTGAWFIPAVETGIALSIIYAAAVALLPRSDNNRPESRMFVITVLIGLLHGLGFSFVLQKILQVTSPNIWQSLLAFNLGVEIGQLAIVFAIWPAFLLLRNLNMRAWVLSRAATALGCIAIAALWSTERIAQLANALFSGPI